MKPLISMLLLVSSIGASIANEADNNNENSINEALNYYRNGDVESAILMLSSLSETNAKAMYSLGIMYLRGKNVTLDKEKRHDLAFQLIKNAANNEYLPAMHILATLYKAGIGTENDNDKAFEWLRYAADEGHPQACYDLALIYYRGTDGFAMDHTSAIRYLYLAAHRNHIKAQSLIGYMYAEGQGTLKDEAKALVWLRKAADSGDETALHNINSIDQDYSQQSATTESQKYWRID